MKISLYLEISIKICQVSKNEELILNTKFWQLLAYKHTMEEKDVTNVETYAK